MMRVLVTGASGFLGGWVYRELAAHGAQIATFSGRELARPSPSTHEALRRAVADAEVICALAAATPLQPEVADPAEFTRANVGALSWLLDAAAAAGPRHVVFASSVMVADPRLRQLGRGTARGAYTESKAAGEDLVARYAAAGGSAVSLRLATLVGPGHPGGRGLVAAALRAASDGHPLPVYGSGSTGRDYLHVLDAAQAVLAAAQRPGGAHRVIDVASGRISTTEQVIVAAERATGRPVVRRHLPVRPDDYQSVCDPGPAGHYLGWSAARPSIAAMVADQWRDRARRGPQVDRSTRHPDREGDHVG